MKKFNAFMTGSALILAAATAGTANAATWDVSMAGVVNIAAAGGNVDFNYTGTWDDTTGVGTFNGHIVPENIAGVFLNTVQGFTMSTTTGKGSLAQASSCVDNSGGNGAPCQGFVPAAKGTLYNGPASGDVHTAPVATAFTPTDGANLTWTLRTIESVDPDSGAVTFAYNPFAVTLTAPSAVPVPAAAWLFGSGLLGLAGISRKRNAG